MNPVLFLLDTSTKITPSGGTQAAADTAAQTGGSFMDNIMANPVMVVVFYCVVLFVAMYFFSVRPQRKREQKMTEMRNAIQIGDDVVLNNGMFGKVVDVAAECFVIEFGLNKSIRIPVVKQEVLGRAEPNLSNKVEEPVEAPKKPGLFSKKTDNSDTSNSNK